MYYGYICDESVTEMVYTNQSNAGAEKPAHTYDNACDVDCNICGKERIPAEHYSEDADGKCDYCGEKFQLSGGVIAGIGIGAVAGSRHWWLCNLLVCCQKEKVKRLIS